MREFAGRAELVDGGRGDGKPRSHFANGQKTLQHRCSKRIAEPCSKILIAIHRVENRQYVPITYEGITPQPLSAPFVLLDVLSDERYVPIRKCPVPWCRPLKRISTS